MRLRAPLILGLLFISLFVAFVFSFYLTPPEMTIFRDTIGIYKPMVIGFQPYWLSKEAKEYSKELSTLTYFGLAVAADGHIRTEDAPGEWEPGWAMLSNSEYQTYLASAKKKGMKLSLLVQNMVEEDITTMLVEPEQSAQNLIADVAPVMKNHGFTDLNLDIENFSIASDSTRMKYVSFVREVKRLLVEGKLGTLTVELTPKSPVEKHFIDVPAIGSIADHVVLMAYDYHYSLSDVAGPVAPVGGAPEVFDYDVEVALRETIRQIPKEKVVLGIPLYGYEWETLSAVPGAPTISKSWSVVSNKNAVEFLASCATCSAQFDEIAKESFVIYPGESDHMHQMYVPDDRSVKAKVELALKYNIGGIAMWAMGYESDTMLYPLQKYKSTVLFRGKNTEPLATTPAFVVSPPSQSLKGTVLQSSLPLKILKRNAPEFVELGDLSIEQGDTLFVDVENTVDIGFGELATLSIGPYTEIDLPELVPPNVIVKQKYGSAVYTLLDTTQTFSVRAHHVLLTLTSGSVEIEMNGDLATITQLEGTSIVGYIDDTNTTYTESLEKGSIARVNYFARTVIVK